MKTSAKYFDLVVGP